MKVLVASLLLLGTLQAQAVKVTDCPLSLQWQIDQFSFDPMLSPTRVPDLHGDCLYDCHNDEGIVNLQYSLQEAAYLSTKLLLVSAKGATCSYEGFSNTHEAVQAQIKGTFAAGSKNQAYLVVLVGSGAYYTQLKAMDPKQIVMAPKSSQIYFQGEYCSHGDCVIDHIRVGSIQKTELSVLR